MEEIAELEEKLAEYQREHKDLDNIINEMMVTPPVDFIQLQRLKKKKLWLKDIIGKLESDLIDDIIA